MLRFVILAVAVYLAWHYFGWRGALVAAGAFVILVLLVNVASGITRGVNARGVRGHTAELMRHKLTDEEKAHYAGTREHERAMIDHRAQFDPDLRKHTDR